ncbi:MAG: amino acid adenylation domain-containing protein [Rhodothermales bacterium]|nr:amino acid adenylation domain-containing protein [Rhodothermales bacterium]
MSTLPLSDRQTRVHAKLRTVLMDLSGFDLQELDNASTFLELGFDSLFLIQFSQAIKKHFGAKISFRQLIEDVSTPVALIGFLDQKVSDDVLPAATAASSAPEAGDGASRVLTPPVSAPVAAPVPAPVATVAPMPAPMPVVMMAPMQGPAADGLKGIMQQQLQLMSMQLAMLTGAPVTPTLAPVALAPAVAMPAEAPAAPAVSIPAEPAQPAARKGKGEKRETVDEALMRKRFGPYKPIQKGKDGGLTPRQQQHLDALVERLTKKTAESKRLAQAYRQCFADPRGIAGFRLMWKEMVYQITTVRSKGSKVWDIDGNEYIDIAMGFGLNLFGHSPDFITDAVAEQLQLGVELGPQSPLAGEVAETLCELTGFDRATFCNTGSEAVMAAIRLARLYTGKTRFIFFSGAYHGNFDQVLARPRPNGQEGAIPAAPGVPWSVAEDCIVLDYSDPRALDVVRERQDEIAMLLVEPVQSSKPDLQPREFLHKLRDLATELDIPLVFDEVISGFRASMGGAQQWFGVKGDMATYGKIIGGGMPMGALAGVSRLMDGLDSGMWNYGDSSVPEADMTFFAGTFVRHPLALAAAKAVLDKLKAEGPSLQENLTLRTKRLVDNVNAFLDERGVPVRLLQYSSLFRFSYAQDMEYIDMLYFHLLDKGIFTRGFLDNCFLSTAHTAEDEERIITALKESIIELQEGGFLPEPGSIELKVGVGSPKEAVAPAELSAGAPTSFVLTESQTEVWLATQIGPEASCAFNEPFYVRLKGPLDVDRLRDAINTTFSRHEALHLRFSRDGQHQHIAAPAPIDIPLHDVSRNREDDRQRAFEAALARNATTPFNLEQGPLVRADILRMTDQEHLLLFAAHHIVCDGWSWSVLIQEIGKRYSASIRGEAFTAPDAGAFSDYVREELEQRTSDDLEESYAYWVEQFTPPPQPLQLPTDRPRPAFKSSCGATVHHVFDPSVYVAAKKIAADLQVSLFSLTMGVFNILMVRLSGQDDVVVAMPTAGQLNYGENHLVGHCVNLLPLRTKLAGDMPVRQFLKQMTTTVLDAFEHNGCTLGGILQRMTLPRHPGRLPIAEVQFNLDRDDRGVALHNLTVEIQQAPRHAVTFDLFFNLNEMKSGFVVDLDYNADLFDASTMQRWISYFESLILSIARDADTPIAQLRMASPDEQHLYEAQRNSTLAELPTATAFHELFEAQAVVTPDKVAVHFTETALTYQELDEYANQFARFLQGMEVGPETVVGVHMERSAGMVVAMLGILKAGGAYVPLDPAYPASRLMHMIQDSGMAILLTENALLEQLDAASFGQGLTVVSMDAEWGKINKRSKNKPKVDLTGDHLAYIIYTSGSTGKPKGVEVSHRALVNLLSAMQDEPGIVDSDVMLNVTTLSFDIAALELFLPIIAGATLVILSKEQSMDGRQLAGAIEQHRITVMQATPATWRMLIESGWKGKVNLKALCGGEALAPALARELLSRCGSLWNMYGPTETTIWSSVHRVAPADKTISIGLPIANTQFYVFDEHMQTAPMGASGELYIGGAGLARGYRNLPELTAERFIANPVAGDGSKLYRTGDLARILPDGTFECLGRTDAQVKVRGFRIELGEIEANMQEHRGVSESAVVVHDRSGLDPVLAAYYTVSSGSAVDAQDLRHFLLQRLPAYMVPTHLVRLDALPHTPNGKVDRKALPAPDEAPTPRSTAFVAPQTPAERTISEIWTQVLGVATIGTADNFFNLGGHSLQATRVIARYRSAFDVELPLRAFFEKPTIGEQALAVIALQTDDDEEDILSMIEELEGLTAAEIAAQLKKAD